ncbi:DNA-directed RNA polymerase II core subunit rpo21, partial [Coemansia sp. 'formosensis']
RMSVAEIEFPELRDEDGKPKIGGLLDPRMGTIDYHVKCHTCGESMGTCQGHFGHITLAKPVFHIGFITKVKKVLECVCWECGKLKADYNDVKFQKIMKIPDATRRMARVWEHCKKFTQCEKPANDDENGAPDVARANGMSGKNSAPNLVDDLIGTYKPKAGCGARQPTFRKMGWTIYVKARTTASDEVPSEREEVTVERVLQTLKKISDEDAEMIGIDPNYARPEWMLLHVMPVPPMAVRPSIQMSATNACEDDLTHKLNDILKSNARLQSCVVEGAPAHVTSKFVELLQFHTTTFMNNELAGLPQATQKDGRPIKSIRARLKGKEGRLRGNLMGKRVDFSARTVITGDPNISIDQVGVPRSIARNLTYPETVTPYNIDKLQEYVRNGPTEHPGAKYVIRNTGERINLLFNKH